MRQYIGARYTPIFLGTHDSTRAYENLSVVDDGVGTSYIANQDVPVGIPLSNTNYWAFYGSTTGAIIDLQNKVTKINKNTKNGYSKIMLVMDSYGSRTYLGETFAQMVENALGCECSLIFASGGGVVNGMIESIINNYNIGDQDEYDCVVYLGGANDETHSTSDITAGMNSLITAIRNKFINVKNVVVGCVGFTFKYGGGYTTETRERVWKAYRASAISNYALYMENSQYILRNDNLLDSDKVHPNSYGVYHLSRQLINYLANGVIEVNYSTDAVITDMNSNTINVQIYRHNNESGIRVLNAGEQLPFLNNSILFDGNIHQIGTIDISMINSDTSSSGIFTQKTSNIVLLPDDSVRRIALYIYNNNVYAYLFPARGQAADTPANFFVIGSSIIFNE